MAIFSGPSANFMSPGRMIEQSRLAALATESQALTKTIRTYFSRARDYTTTPFGAPVAGLLVANQGAIVLRSDLRDLNANTCNVFNPNSPVFTTVALMCCQPGININAAIPAGGAVNLTSACQAGKWGLSVFEINGGAVTSRQCYQDVIGMNIFNLGPQALTYGSTTASVSNALLFEFVGQTHYDFGQPSGINALHFTVSTSPGNTPNNPLVNCSRLGQFN